MPTPLSAADYYDFFPASSHNPGDIWIGMPTFGIIPKSHVPGLVVTPACDLSNRKVETITYVPILPVAEYMVSRSAMPDIKRAIRGQLEAAGLGDLISFPEAFESPSVSELGAAVTLLTEQQHNTASSQKVRSSLERAVAGLRLLSAICGAGGATGRIADLRLLLGVRAFDENVKRLITNARPDVHFLPADAQRAEWTAVPFHSLAMFRFPLTLPLELMDIAQRVTEADWTQAARRFEGVLPCVSSLQARPMKRLHVLPRFGSDLVNRYTSMFGRLGSPDFTPETVGRFAEEIQEAQ